MKIFTLKPKTYNYFIILILFGSLLIAGIINIIVDPLCFFSHENYLNKEYPAGYNDERTTKTIRISRDSTPYTAVLLGSSRASYIKSADFKTFRLFNYALGDLRPFEYKGYLHFFAQHKNVDYIIIGLDFFASNKNGKLSGKEKYLKEQQQRFIDAKNFNFFIQSYFSFNRCQSAP